MENLETFSTSIWLDFGDMARFVPNLRLSGYRLDFRFYYGDYMDDPLETEHVQQATGIQVLFPENVKVSSFPRAQYLEFVEHSPEGCRPVTRQMFTTRRFEFTREDVLLYKFHLLGTPVLVPIEFGISAFTTRRRSGLTHHQDSIGHEIAIDPVSNSITLWTWWEVKT